MVARVARGTFLQPPARRRQAAVTLWQGKFVGRILASVHLSILSA